MLLRKLLAFRCRFRIVLTHRRVEVSKTAGAIDNSLPFRLAHSLYQLGQRKQQ